MKILQLNESDNLTKSEKQSLATLTGIFIIGFFYVLGNSNYNIPEQEMSESEMLTLASEMTDSKLDLFFSSLDLKASSVLIFDSANKQNIFAKDTQKVMPLASLVKIMTAIVAIENIGESETISIPKEALSLAGDNGLLVDEKWSRDDLLRFALITSSNDATRAISMHYGKNQGLTTQEESVQAFVDLMNEKARQLGLNETLFLNESGLDLGDGRNGGYGNLEEVITLFDYALNKYPDIFIPTSLASKNFISKSNISHNALNTNQNVSKVLGISASKTGFTNISGGNLVVSIKTEKGGNILVGVLGSTFSDRFTDIEKLSATTLKIINEVQL